MAAKDETAGRLGPVAAHSALRLMLFGGCEIATGDGAQVALASRKARAVLAILALTDGMSMGRDRICGLLWAEAAEEQARASLRQCVKLIRQALGDAADAVLQGDRITLGLEPRIVETDVGAFLDRLGKGDLGSPLLQRPLVHETLLAGFDGLDESFDSWLAFWRETLRRRVQAATEAAMAPDNPLERQEAGAEALLALDPAHEPALRNLLRLRAGRGDRQGALRLFEGFRQRLAADYDAMPEPETEALVQSLRAPAMPERAAVPPAMASRQVAPFVESGGDTAGTVISVVQEASGDPVTDAAARGFATQLRGMLARFRHWTVVDTDPRGPGGVPDGCHVLRLAPAAPNQGMTLAVHLSGTGPARATLWTSHVDLTTARTLESQETVLRGICGALDVYVSQARMVQLRLRAPHSLNALEKWMRGAQLMDQWDPDADARAEALFHEALHSWPDHPTLLANLADLYNTRHIVFPGVRRDGERERKAMQLARRAVALDPLDPRCHVTLGWSLAMAGRIEQAVHSFLRGHDLNPADPSIAMSAAHGLGVLDRLDDAFRLCRAAFDCHPAPPWSYWGFEANLRFLAGDYAGAVDSADRSGEIMLSIAGWKSAAMGMAGDPRAPAEAEDFLARITDGWTTGPAPQPAEAIDWYVAIFPFARPAQRDHLREGLRRAGLPA